MAHTNSTENYGLPQWIGTDKPTFLGDFNSAFATIDAGMKASADVATAAATTANAADATATSAATNATNAITIANNAATEAASATSAASSATATANTAKTTADSAMRASASNSIENLAPAYDPTLTYNVGDLVTYIDAQNSGKLYKCIVPVNTPMDFNINYWDDVTTSEVYITEKSKVVASVTASAGQTNGSMLEALFSQFSTFDRTKEYLLVRIGATVTTILHASTIRDNSVDFFECARASGAEFNTTFYELGATSIVYIFALATSGTITATNATSNSVPDGAIFKLIELTTA